MVEPESTSIFQIPKSETSQTPTSQFLRFSCGQEIKEFLALEDSRNDLEIMSAFLMLKIERKIEFSSFPTPHRSE